MNDFKFVQSIKNEIADLILDDLVFGSRVLERVEVDDDETWFSMYSDTTLTTRRLVRKNKEEWNYYISTREDFCNICVDKDKYCKKSCKFCNGTTHLVKFPCKACRGDGCEYINHGRSAVDCEDCKGTGFSKNETI